MSSEYRFQKHFHIYSSCERRKIYEILQYITDQHQLNIFKKNENNFVTDEKTGRLQIADN